MKPCRHETLKDGCRICWLFANHPHYHAAWSDAGTGPVPRPIPTRCIHFGPVVEVSGNGCNRCHTMDCAVAGYTTIRDCMVCPEYQEQPKRHLLMHLWPVAGTGVWQLRLEQLKQRLWLFNGARIIRVVTGPGTDSLADVRAALAGQRVTLLHGVNDPVLQEMGSWDALWSQLRGKAGSVFYCHGKQTKTPLTAHTGVHRWAEVMFESCLDYWPLVEKRLKQGAMAGSFRRKDHYAGTFFWVRLDRVGDKWREVNRAWNGSEMWPGIHFDWRSLGSLFTPAATADQLYDGDGFRNVVWPQWEEWKCLSQRFRLPLPSTASLNS